MSKVKAINLTNSPRSGYSDNRILGFIVPASQLPDMSDFTGLLEEYCIDFIKMRGYTISGKRDILAFKEKHHVR